MREDIYLQLERDYISLAVEVMNAVEAWKKKDQEAMDISFAKLEKVVNPQ